VGRSRRGLLAGDEAGGAAGPHYSDYGGDDDTHDRRRARGRDSFGRRCNGGVDDHDSRGDIHDGCPGFDGNEFSTADDDDEADGDNDEHRARAGR
jgi:hypothetical protein